MKMSQVLRFVFVLMVVAGATLIVPVAGLANCPEGITAYWKLDELAGGPYLDFIGTNDAVTGTGDPDPAPAVGINGAQRFRAANTDGLDVPASSAFNWTSTDSFSIELWVQTDGNVTPAGVQVFIGRDDFNGSGVQWWIGMNDGNAVAFFRDSSAAEVYLEGGDISDGNPHHVVFVRDGSTDTNRLYIDGIAASTATETVPFPAGFALNDQALNIGYLNLSPFYHFDGFLDEIALYSQALTQTEINANRSAGLAGIDYCLGSETSSAFAPYPDNTVSLWHLDEAGGSLYADAVGTNDAVTGTGDPDPAPTVGINGAQRFRAANTDGLDVPASSAFNWTSKDSFSIEFWVQTEGPVIPGRAQVFIGRDDTGPGRSGVQWWIGVNEGGEAVFYFFDGSGASANGTGPFLIDGNPHHVVFVRDGSTDTNRLFIDGTAAPGATITQAFPEGFWLNDPAVNIGYLNRFPTFHFDGFLDEIALYSRALTQTEINAHRTALSSGNSVASLKPAPNANAGQDQTNVPIQSLVTLDGSASAVGYPGTTLTYLWVQTAGTTVTLTGAGTPTATFTANSVETLTFQLTVTASDGQPSIDTVNVGVINLVAPVADAGADRSVVEGIEVTLAGSATGGTGAIVTYAWVQTAGTPVTLTGADTPTATFTAPQVDADQALTFGFTVTDDNDLTHTDTVTITVTDSGTTPPPAGGGGGGGGCFINSLF